MDNTACFSTTSQKSSKILNFHADVQILGIRQEKQEFLITDFVKIWKPRNSMLVTKYSVALLEPWLYLKLTSSLNYDVHL
jgi:hypothetical protein